MRNEFPTTGPGRFMGGIMAVVFGGIGVTVLVFLWTARGFGAPPLIFRLVGSFIALAFVGFGVFGIVTAIRGMPPGRPHVDAQSPGERGGGEYECPHCGAALTGNVDVSPSGDVKCPYCSSWFNVHRG